MTYFKMLARIAPLAAVVACSNLTNVSAPDIVLPDTQWSGIPYGDSAPVSFTYGKPLTRDPVLKIASAHLDAAVAYSKDPARFDAFARVTKARTLLNLDDYAGVAAVVASVPT